MTGQTIRIGGATGFWGETDLAMAQFLKEPSLDYIVFDYLAEITMSILARARAADENLGYATDFVTAMMKPNLASIAHAGIKIISNAGGVNPRQCAAAIRELIAEAGLDLKVAVVMGDDLFSQLPELAQDNPPEMFSGESLPPLEKVASANAYLGAFPIAEALASGADIVITGRCVDSAVTLGACIHAFGWQPIEYDKLAAGSLAGHIIECGPQATGGNYTDWESVADSLHNVGYPIAEISGDGTFNITKPDDTGGTVTCGTVGEQLLYEIGDPAEYLLPDVVCDFSGVTLRQLEPDCVEVVGARGRGAPSDYKVSLTWFDGWRAGTTVWYLGRRAADKAKIFAREAVERTRRKLSRWGVGDFDDLAIDIIGNESHWGEHAKYHRSREVALKLACRHQDKRAVALLLKEISGVALGAPPGLAFFAGTRAKPSPVVRLFSMTIPKTHVDITIDNGLTVQKVIAAPVVESVDLPPIREVPADPCGANTDENIVDNNGENAFIEVPLESLAWARSGDKGDKANIGVMARKNAYMPWIAAVLTEAYVRDRFSHLMTSERLERFYLPGLPALNFVLHNALGGGGIASLRDDPQAKSFAQILLDTPVKIPASLMEN